MDREAHATRPTTGALFALLYRPGPRWVRGEPLDRQPLAAHRAYLEGLARAGRVAIAGPFLDAAAGLAVLRVADAEAAAAVLADDPAVRDGVLAGEVRRWLPLIGDMAPGQRAAANVEAVRRVFAAVEARGDGGPGGTRGGRCTATPTPPKRRSTRRRACPTAATTRVPTRSSATPGATTRRGTGCRTWPSALEPECLAGGDRVAVLWRQRARGPATGERFDMPAVSVFELRGGRVVDARMFHFDAGAAAAFLRRAKAAAAP